MSSQRTNHHTTETVKRKRPTTDAGSISFLRTNTLPTRLVQTNSLTSRLQPAALCLRAFSRNDLNPPTNLVTYSSSTSLRLRASQRPRPTLPRAMPPCTLKTAPARRNTCHVPACAASETATQSKSTKRSPMRRRQLDMFQYLYRGANTHASRELVTGKGHGLNAPGPIHIRR